MSDVSISPLDPSRQIAFHQLLVSARKTWLMDALLEAMSRTEPRHIKNQLLEYVPPDAQRILATTGIRDELVFPVPILLETAPTLVGYYRLLLGVPQKSFYGSGTGMGRFKAMEVRGTINSRQKGALPDFCRAMCTALADLVRQLSPAITPRDVTELPLLTLGSLFQGANNVLIGKQATADVFLSIRAVLGNALIESHSQKMVVTNASGRQVVFTLGSDPDIRIEEDFAGSLHKKVAIEIKGGTDRSNAHNRAGEAEKSHQKAKRQGFRDFWTIIALKSLDLDKLKAESPTTNSWYDVAQVLGRHGPDWDDFRNRMSDVAGLPLTPTSRQR